MGSTLDLGQRIELVPMDSHFSNITIGLYEQSLNGASGYLVHSYSGVPGVRGRLDSIIHAMQVLAGLQLCDGQLRYPCGARHPLAMRRTFLEACKLDPHTAPEPRPMEILDKKLDRQVFAHSLSPGLYELTLAEAAAGAVNGAASRLESITGGMRKLAEVDFVPGQPHRFQFACNHPHDELVGLLLPRALNVRAILREQEMAASRGTLVAPSAQK